MDSKQEFVVGSWVVYPSHGVGKLESIDKMSISGNDVEFFVIRFQKNKLVLKIPTKKAFESGLRNISSKDELSCIFDILSTKTPRKKLVWSKRLQDYNNKINSGNLSMIAEVIRDIYKEGGVLCMSFSERQIYQGAVERLAKEISIIEDDDEVNVIQKIEKALAA